MRYRWETAGGKPVYAEVRPDACPHGHTRLGASWGQCDRCGALGRKWRCLEEGCDGVVFDYDHVCGRRQQPDRPVL